MHNSRNVGQKFVLRILFMLGLQLIFLRNELFYGASLPDGDTVLYCYQSTMGGTIYKISIDGSGNNRVFTAAMSMHHPDWSPDASKIAVVGQVNNSTYSIFTLNYNGSGLKRLTSMADVLDAEPNYSPDSRKIAFSRVYPSPNLKRELWLMNSDGNNQRNLGVEVGDAAEWSPDGKLLVYSSKVNERWEIYTIRIDDLTITKLTNLNSVNILQPSYSSSGSEILFNVDENDTGKIFSMNPDGTNIRQIAVMNTSIWKSFYSHDGSKIVFCTTTPGYADHWEVYVMNSDGSNVRRVTNSIGTNTAIDPDWKPVMAEPYFGDSPPDSVPRPFAANFIPANSWGITFSPDGRECFFTVPNAPNTIYTSKGLSQGWQVPAAAQFSGSYFDMEPHITPDGSRLYFGSKRPNGGIIPTDLRQWYAIKTDTGWSAAAPMDTVLRDIPMMYPSVADNKNMFFTTSADGFNTQWISVSRYVNGCYQLPEKLSDSVNFSLTAAHPFIARDESFIIFDVLSMPGYSGDLYVSFKKQDGSWTKAISAGPNVNTSAHEVCPFISRDGKYLFFYRANRIYWVSASFIGRLNPLTSSLTLEELKPEKFQLYQNYPNPFNPSTRITYSMPEMALVTLNVYNILGQRINTIFAEIQNAGLHETEWKGEDESGNIVSAGVYFIRLSSNGMNQTMKALLVR